MRYGTAAVQTNRGHQSTADGDAAHHTILTHTRTKHHAYRTRYVHTVHGAKINDAPAPLTVCKHATVTHTAHTTATYPFHALHSTRPHHNIHLPMGCATAQAPP
jgi:hypothetical protein